MKKPRSSDKKAKYGPGEKRRKRWYEAIIGKESTGPSQDDWMPQQRSRSAFLVIPTKPRTADETHARKYQLLMKLVENSEKQPNMKKKSKTKKTKKKAHGLSPTREPSTSSLFSLPLPEVSYNS